MHQLGFIPVGLTPDDLQGEHNIPPDDENGGNGGGIPPIPYGQVPWQHMQPQQPPQPPLPPQSPELKDEDNFYAPEEPHTPQHAPTPVRDLDPTPRGRIHVRCEPRPKPLARMWGLGNPKKDERWDTYYRHHPYSSDSRSRPSGNDSHSICGKSSSDAESSYPRQPLSSPFREQSPQPQEELLGSLPRCSGYVRRPTICPDNVYGSQNLSQTEQMSSQEFRKIIEGVPAPSEAPNNRLNSPRDKENMVNQMVQEGGADLINFLLSAAVSSAPAKGKIPNVSKVREWQYRDLMHLPMATQEEWKTACKEELEALHQRNVFKLTDLHKGCKTIGCRWVFDVKSDG